METLKHLMLFPRLAVLKLIRIYQKTLSFDHGIFKDQFPHGFCRFKPTCSEYGYEAIFKYGIVRGGIKTLWRVTRCNPWSKGGIDPVDKVTDHGSRNTDHEAHSTEHGSRST